MLSHAVYNCADPLGLRQQDLSRSAYPDDVGDLGCRPISTLGYGTMLTHFVKESVGYPSLGPTWQPTLGRDTTHSFA